MQPSSPLNQPLHPNLVVCPSKALVSLFTKLRDVNTTPSEFVFYSKRAMRILAEDAIAELPSQSPITITTPCGTHTGIEIRTNQNNLCAVSIVRSGDALVESVRECIPDIPVGKILIQRDETTIEKKANYLYSKMPPGIAQMDILLCDPMLATGGSVKAAIRALVDLHGVSTDRIVFCNMITCPEGLGVMAEEYPEIKIVTVCVDDCLNGDNFIVPGLGDYGDRFFNTV